MANEKQTTTNAVVQRDVNQVTYQAGGEEITLNPTTIRNYLTRGNVEITGQEAILFMNLCKYQKLNPFLNEAYLVKYQKDKPADIIVGKEAFMKRAEEHEQYDGYRAGLIISRNGEILEIEGSFTIKGDILLGGWAEVYRKDRKYPIVAKVGFDEYNTGKSTWSGKPKTMIRKVALVQALREAFPKNLGGMYIEEETEFVVAPDAIVEDKKEETKKEANSKPFVVNEEKPTSKVTTKDTEKIIDVELTDVSSDEGPKW